MTEEFRKSPPAPLEALSFKLPDPVEATLSCGLKVVAVHDKRQPLLNVRLVLQTGDINDPAGGVGVSSAVASLVNEGTENYSSREMAEAIDRIGADLSASSASDHTVIKASSLSMFSGEVLDLMSEIVLRPTFPENELDLYRQNTIEGLKYQRSQPDFLADEQVGRLVYGIHPYSVHSPSPHDLLALKRDQLIEFHGRTFVPNNAMLIAVGDVEPESLFSELEARFSGWSLGELPGVELPPFPERSRRTLTIVDRPGSTQSNIVLSNLAMERRNPDYFPFLVMNQVLGAGASSRLFMNLREEKGYTYGAYSRIYARRFGGSFEATAEVRTAVTGDSLREFFYELERMRDEPVRNEELKDAADFLTGVFPIRVETQGGLIGQIVAQRLYGLPDDYLETYVDNVRAVTVEDVGNAARRYVHPESIAIVIVGDAHEVIAQAEGFSGEVEIFDTQGKPLDVNDYRHGSNVPQAEVGGHWDLQVNAQGQTMALKLDLERTDAGIRGSLDSMLGTGVVSKAEVHGSRFTGTVVAEMQGQEIELAIAGSVSGDSMSGTITIPMIPEALQFTGVRSG